jgi:para-aminobenzoate synthetase component 1
MPDARGRWSFFGADPFAIFGPDRYDEAVALWRGTRDEFAEAGAAGAPNVPFAGGLVGCWSYDFGRRLERIPAIARDDVAWPDVWLAAYDVVGALDHSTGEAWLISSGLPAAAGDRARRAEARLDEFARRLESPPPDLDASPRFASIVEARSTFTADEYRASVEQVREHIRRGDIFQANLSQRWTVAARTAPAAFGRRLFAELARHSAAPFAAYLDLGERAAVSASPERFLELNGRQVETRPIKGTRPRGLDAASDAAERAALLASAKDRAENVMIVDVLRNDLGRVCETGSVAVPELCALEAFPQVFHLTSTVTGRLGAGRDAFDLLHACFPGGSITGAPKIRAMEILEQLEPVRRHLYTGAIGYLDWSGDASSSIAIRTAMVTRDAIHFAAGGGITADSDPEAEYRETLAKAEGMRVALSACLGELALVGAEPVANAERR